MIDLTGKTILVTGGSRGIGAATVRHLVAQGGSVVVHFGSNLTAAQALAHEFGEPSIHLCQADLTSESETERLWDKAVAWHGRIDVLVNNAGKISPVKHVLEVDKAWWDALIGVNLTGTFMCSRRAAHMMARQGSGSIINMSSGGGTKAHRAFVAYDASKGGIEAMTRAMALDLGPYGVRVNCLVPGFINTYDASEKVQQEQGDIVPLGRMGGAEDMAGSAVFLASPDAAYITGQRIVIDGGVLVQQRSANVDTYPPSRFPKLD